MATRSGELRNAIFSAKIKFLAEEKREFSTFLAISCNRCCAFGFLFILIFGIASVPFKSEVLKIIYYEIFQIR